MYNNIQEKLGVMSSFKEISIQFELFHKNFLRVSCEPRTVQGIIVDSRILQDRWQGRMASWRTRDYCFTSKTWTLYSRSVI